MRRLLALALLLAACRSPQLVTLADWQGTGPTTTPVFTTTARRWPLALTFTGEDRNARVYVRAERYGAIAAAVARVAPVTDTITVDAPPGRYYLDVQTQATWHLVVREAQ